MIQDVLALFNDKTDISAYTIANSPYGSKSIDTFATGSPAATGPIGAIGGPLLHDIGRGRKLQIFAQITTAPDSAAHTATIKVDFISSAAATLTAPTVLNSTAAIVVTALVAGYRFRLGNIPAGIAQRYIGVQYTIAVQDLNAGAVTAGLQFDTDQHADILG